MTRTQVVIIGAGPAGLLLSQLLHNCGVDTVILERQSREHVAARIRAGVLEQGTVELLIKAGVGQRMLSERLVHEGFALAFADRSFRVDLRGLTGAAVSVYGQTELTKDLIEARIAAGARLIYDAADVAIDGFDRPHPTVRCVHAGQTLEINCDFIAGCDGFHGICRKSVPAGAVHGNPFFHDRLGVRSVDSGQLAAQAKETQQQLVALPSELFEPAATNLLQHAVNDVFLQFRRELGSAKISPKLPQWGAPTSFTWLRSGRSSTCGRNGA